MIKERETACKLLELAEPLAVQVAVGLQLLFTAVVMLAGGFATFKLFEWLTF